MHVHYKNQSVIPLSECNATLVAIRYTDWAISAPKMLL
jgi:hypothetical protein